VLGVMTRSAAFRAELEPERSAAFYLRLGPQEGWVFTAVFVLGFVLAIAQFVLMIPVMMVTSLGMVGSALSAGHDPAAIMSSMVGFIGLRFLLQLPILAVAIWLWLRFSLGIVMSYRERQFRLFESWALTRGHTIRMFLVMLANAGVIFGLQIVLWTVAWIGALLILPGLGVWTDPTAFFARPPSAWIQPFLPLIALLGVLGAIIVGVGNALVYGSLARMHQQLAGDPSEVMA
jgi:hypothetical protein